MKRETRANLIFLTIFFALAAPGIYKLTAKAYQNGGRDPAMRRPVRGEWAYMDPTPPAGLLRVVPPGVATYVKQIVERLAQMEPGLRSAVADADRLPIMSDHFNIQLLGTVGGAGTYRVAMLGWNSTYAPLPSLFTITGDRNGVEVNGAMTSWEPQILPMELRSELQDYGYIIPPDSALWMIATFPGEVPLDSVRVKFTLDKRQLDDVLSINVPNTQPASQPTTAPATP